MKNKIYDIIPPNKQEKVFKGKKPRKKKSYQREFLVGVFLFVIVVGVFLFFNLSESDVRVWIKTTLQEDFKEVVVVDKEVEEVDFEKKNIPGKLIEIEEESWLYNIDSTGVVTEEEKATGKIKIYNEYTPIRSFNFVRGTRFLSDEGKYFISINPIHIPAAEQRGSELIPGVVEVEVIAREPGEDHNIKPSEFSIPGLAGTDFYYSLYGKSEEPMRGGIIKETKYVTESDIKKAKSELEKELLEKADNNLREKISDNFVIKEEFISKEIIELTPLVEVTDKVDQFTVQGKVKVEALVFKEKDLREFAIEHIDSRVEEEIFKESLEMEHLVEDINLEDNKIVLNLEFSVKTYLDKEEKEIFKLIKGRGGEEAKDIIYSNYLEEVDRVEIEFWPFWVTWVPDNENKVNIEFIIE